MIAIINYNSGNIASVCNALESLGQDYVLTNDPAQIQKADRVIFPGQGRAKFAMAQLKESGLIDVIKDLGVPFLGICLGLQLLANSTDEDDVECLQIVNGEVVKFPETVKIPQIGWNQVKTIKDSPLFQDIPDNSFFYFVNSFYFRGKGTIATSNYGAEFCAAIQKDNFFATQFHPEKSGEIGLKLLNNFCKL